MVGALVWKEYREQRAAWLCSAVAGSVLLLTWAFLLARLPSTTPSTADPTHTLLCGVVLLTWAYGMLCGAMLLAGERENGTLGFLDTLPGWRGQVWRHKCLAGLALVLSQAAILDGVLAALRLAGTAQDAALGLAVAVGAGLVGMSWGAWTSARAEGVLQALWQAMLGQLLAGSALGFGVTMIGLALLPQSYGALAPLLRAAVLIGGLAAVAALAGSARIFVRPDQDRRGAHASGTVHVFWRSNWAAASWLTARQSWRFIGLTCLLGLLTGLAVAAFPLAAWPLATLIVGSWCGARAFTADEEVTRRLLADQRLPLGRFWLARLVPLTMLAALGCFCCLVPTLALRIPPLLEVGPGMHWGPNFLGRLFNDDALGALVPAGTFLSLWPVYGFAAGVLCGQFRRAAIGATAVAVVVATLTAALWVPSLAGGELHWWQVLGAPLTMLLVSRLLLPAWAAREVRGRRSVAPLAVGLTLAAVWTAAGLWYRVAEVPMPSDSFDVDGFLATLDEPGPLEAAQRCRAALALNHRNPLLMKKAPRPLFDARGGQAGSLLYWTGLDEILSRGWPANRPEMALWLDRMCAGPWPVELAASLRGPPALLVDPRIISGPNLFDPVGGQAELAVKLLSVHGLRHHARGSPATFANDLATALALVRSRKYRAPTFGWQSAESCERDALSGLDRWLERLPNEAAALRAALATLRRHETDCPSNAREALRANAVVTLNTLRQPQAWVPPQGFSPGPVTNSARIAAFSWQEQVPWERLRQERLLPYLVPPFRAPNPLVDFPSPWRRPPLPYAALQDQEHTALVQRRAALLKVALRLYQAEKGRPATSLQPLVPAYLPVLPADPFDAEGRSFRYRLSAGEDVRIGWLDPRTGRRRIGPRRVPAGQGILWSVGPDGRDDGGRQDSFGARRSDPAWDWIFIVESPQS